MIYSRKFLITILLVFIVASCIFFLKKQASFVNESILNSPQFNGETFQNNPEVSLMNSSDMRKMISRSIFEDAVDNTPDWEIPIAALTKNNISKLPGNKVSIIKLGHSSILLKISNQLWIIDPVFSERTSPISFIGPKRFHPTPIDIESLPYLKGVIISHNHYDHFDENSIKKLKNKAEFFLVPLGLSKNLLDWGINKEKIIEFDWWQSMSFENLDIIATPAQHFSGRGLFDRNKTLWNSWVLKSTEHSVFYSGDSGYFNGFKKIAEKFGDFDITLLEVGAYDKLWPAVHMQPDDAIQAFNDLKGKALIPVHNGTFDLAFHPWYEPLNRMLTLAKDKKINLVTPQVGQIYIYEEPFYNTTWWRKK